MVFIISYIYFERGIDWFRGFVCNIGVGRNRVILVFFYWFSNIGWKKYVYGF